MYHINKLKDMKEISNYDLGINESDIRLCKDRDELLDWKFFLGKQHTSISNQILELSVNFNEGLSTDSKLYRNLVKDRKEINILKELIQNSLTSINRKEKRVKAKTMDRIIINLVEEIYGEEIFKEITTEAIERYNKLNNIHDE